MDKHDAEGVLRFMRREWFKKRKGIMALLREVIYQEGRVGTKALRLLDAYVRRLASMRSWRDSRLLKLAQ